MENPKTQITERLKQANNVLITVSTNPTVDQLSAAIGLTLLLNKLKKHAATVFSGQVPSTIEFLKPEETIEKNTDSLRDFIIALDKSKADKIRYKVEDTMVKIFITPYRTSIGEPDLQFSQGDFNVDVVIALGVHARDDLDQAITSHGRILHDATVATINTQAGSDLGSLNWTDAQASSLCEMVVALADLLKANSLDGQMATALLTGIVSETDRFSNAKTTSNTMAASSKLMAAGANQQLIATKLEEPEPPEPPAPPPQAPADGSPPAKPPADSTVSDDGSLLINHEEPPEKPLEQIKIDDQGQLQPATPPPSKPLPPKPPEPPAQKPSVPEPPLPSPEPAPPKKQKEDEEASLLPPLPPPKPEPEVKREHREFLDNPTPQASKQFEGGVQDGLELPQDSHMVLQPPSMGGKLSASADEFDQDTSPLSLPSVEPPILSHKPKSSRRNKPASRRQRSAQQNPPAAEPSPPSPEPSPAPPPPPPPIITPSKPAEPAEPLFPPEPPEEPKPEPPPPPPPKEPEPSTLPRSVIDVMDDQTLDHIEEAVDSPHHVEQPAPPKKASAPAPKAPPLEYEAHESEPAETPVKFGKKAAQPPKAPSMPPPPPPLPAESPIAPPPPPLPFQPPPPPPPQQPPAAEPAPDLATTKPDANEARDAVNAAINAVDEPPHPLESLGAVDPHLDLGHNSDQPAASPIHIDQEGQVSFPQNLVPDTSTLPPDNTGSSVPSPTPPPPMADEGSAPPPVPPPFPMPPADTQNPPKPV